MESTETVLSLTPAAVDKVESFIEEHGAAKGAGLRVAVLPGGCSGFQYGLNIENGPEDDDEILELSGVRIFLDPFSMQYLEGVEIDYVTSMMGAGFTFRNPNATGGCGCGSFLHGLTQFSALRWAASPCPRAAFLPDHGKPS